MSRAPNSYFPGIVAVSGTLLVSLLLCLFVVGPRPTAARRAALDLSGSPLPLGPFAWTDQSGRSVTDRTLDEDVWIGSFIFTRCRVSCPRITAVVKGLQEKLKGTGVRLVSVSVDPEHDTPEVLADYARGFGADAGRWLFLTGEKGALHHWIIDRFKVPVRDATEVELAQGAEDVAHSSRLALVDRGNRVVGYFDADSPQEVDQLAQRARKLDSRWGRVLPKVNAALNGASALALLAGWSFIRRGRIREHAACMLTAVGLSALFLVSYLTYHFAVIGGSVPFQGEGRVVRVVYFTILLSHTVLAAVMAPMVVMTLVLALRRRFSAHSRLARLTFPIWTYVAVTGVLVYVMLYEMPVTSVTGSV